MRVLFCTYDLAMERRGGGERVMESLAEELRLLGAEVAFFDPWLHDPANFDLIHYFSTKQPETWAYLKRACPKVPLVVTPTFPVAAKPGRALRESFRYPDLFLPATASEKNALSAWVPSCKLVVLANGVKALAPADPGLFHERTGLGGAELILCVGRFDPVKNQMLLIEAMRHLKSSNCVFVGGADTNYPNYLDACRARADLVSRASGNKIIFLGEVTHEGPLLPSAYAAARVFALPSKFETFGLAALEAALAGCNLALSSGMAGKEMFEPDAEFFDPAQPKSCAGAIERAQKKKWPTSRIILSEKYSWPMIASTLNKLYRDLINGRDFSME